MQRFASGTRRTALCGLLIALSAVCLYLATFVPTNKIAVTALAGLFPAAAVVLTGRGGGFLCWAGSGILGLLLAPEKWLALLYLLFLGLYPVVKSILESIRSRILEWICKLVYFNGVLAVFWFGLRNVFLPALPAFMQQTAALFFVLNVVFVIYDLGLSRLIMAYSRRLGSALGRKD